MRIAEAIERVKRQARQSGLGAMIGGVGEHLRSAAVPSPLRGAAWRIANLLDAACPNASAAPNQRARELIHQDRAAIRSDPTSAKAARAEGAMDRASAAATRPQSAVALHEDVSPSSAAKAPVEVPVAQVSSARVDQSARVPVREVSATAVDSGASPSEPIEGTKVDPRKVDATPTFNATPVQVEPVDATPTDDAPIDALDEVLEVSADETVEVKATNDDAGSARTTEPMADERASARAEVALQVEPAESASDAADGAPHKGRGTEQERGEREKRAVEAARESASIETSAPATDVGEMAQIDAALRADLAGTDSDRPVKASAPSEPPRAGADAPKASKQRSKSQGAKKRSTPPPSAAAQPEKEKLAPSSEDAKNLARSTSRSTKRRSGAKADTSKKK